MASNRRTFDSREMARRGRIGAHTQHSRHDTRETTKAAHAGRKKKYLRLVDPDGVLPEAERERRAYSLMCADMTRLRHRQITRQQRQG